MKTRLMTMFHQSQVVRLLILMKVNCQTRVSCQMKTRTMFHQSLLDKASQPSSGNDSHELESDPRNVNKKGTRKCHKHKTPEEWKRQVIKNKRLKGESYKNVKGQDIQAKVIGPACTSTFCKKSNLQHCPSLSEKQRKDIFDQFWKMNTWEECQLYVYALVDRV